MIVNEHIEDYINSLGSDMAPELDRLEAWALDNGVPIIRKSMQTLLRFILIKEKPKRILEVGAAIGFSALFMSNNIPKDSHITTIEKVEMRLVEARKNLAGNDKITLLEGDALEVLENLANEVSEETKFDFVFLDAAKGQYLNFLKSIRKLMAPGALLITDNILLEGSIAESKFSIERRDRTIHLRMREYLHEITHSPDFETVILPLGDGVAVSYFMKERNE
ncbi:MAG: O-methyltransferase [Lachnospiraceae bacterium]|nr:O-methyltransferase [Lachnospiraceae bacterium]